MTFRLFFFSTIAFLLASPLKAAASPAGDGLQKAVKNSGLPTGSIESMAANFIIVVLGIVGVLFMLLILYGGYVWMMGSRAGKEKEINNAKTILTNATIGLLLVLAAYAITYFIVQQINFATTGTLEPDLDTGDPGVPYVDPGPA
ncbi:MAG: pilin [Candidatus Komeilibacteria bacterium]